MSKKQVLIIDDDLELCGELIELLEYEGYSAEHVQDAVKAEEQIRSGSYDAILLDFKLHTFTGADILKKLKADNIIKRIFIFSGRPFIEHVLEKEDLTGIVSGIITKPFKFETLLEKIKEE